jgi:hypothetical protein
MKKYVGIWLDHRQAYVVTLLREKPAEEGKEMIEGIESNMARRVRLSGGSRTRKTPYGPQNIAVDGKQEAHIKRQLKDYYKQIIARMVDADRILIFGPGEAKIELKKAIQKSDQIAKRLVKMESADKMTARQIAAKTRNYFKAKS